MDESIQEGDWVELENKTQGQVKKIRWRHTVLETREWDTIIVPNGLLMGQPIRVLGRRGGRNVPRRITIHFCIDFRYAPMDVIRAVNAALADAPIERVAGNPAPHCLCLDLAQATRDSYALYGVRYWLADLDTDEPVNSKVRERIWVALKRAQIPLAIPAAALFISQDDPEHDERKLRREMASKRAALESVDLFSKLSVEEKDALSQQREVRALRSRRAHHAPGRAGSVALHPDLGPSRGARSRQRSRRPSGGDARGPELLRRNGAHDRASSRGHGGRAHGGRTACASTRPTSRASS